MKKNLVRNLTIVAGLFVIAFFAKMEAINAIIAIWIGIWSMIKLFKPFFKSGESVGNLSTVDFIPEPRHITFNFSKSQIEVVDRTGSQKSYHRESR